MKRAERSNRAEVYEIAKAFMSASTLDELLNRIAECVTRAMGVKGCLIRLLDDKGERLELAANFGLSNGYIKKGPIEVAKSLVDKEVLKGNNIAIFNVAKDTRWQYPEEARTEKIFSVLSIPLAHKDKIIGVIRVYTSKPHRFNKKDIHFLSCIASLGTLGIENARLFHGLEKKCEEMSTLLEVAKVISSNLSLNEVLSSITKISADTMRAKASSIRLLDEKTNKLELVASYGLSEEYIKKGPIRADRSIKEIMEGKPVIVRDVSQDSRIQYPAEARKEGIYSILGVPLSLKDRIIGVIRIYSSTSRLFTSEEINLLTAMASHAAIAIENARMYQLTRRKLVEIQDQLIRSERLAALGKLAAGVAHEINNPLSGVSIYANLLLEKTLKDNPQYSRLEKICNEVSRCKRIVTGLLEFASQSEPMKQLININDVVEKSISLVESQALFHNIKIIKKLNPALPKLMADSSQLQQVFMNILINAAEAIKDAGTVTIKTVISKQRQWVEVKFNDTGCGIPKENLSKVFEPFFTTKEAGKGTGLGLAVSYGIIERHGGSIKVKSEVGKGSTFIIHLPLGDKE